METVQMVVAILQLLTLALQVLMLIATWRMVAISLDTFKHSKNGKMAEIMLSCVDAYQQLENQLVHSEFKKNELRYFELLWNLHFAQYHFHKLKCIPKDVYVNWLWIRHQAYHGAGPRLSTSQQDGWLHAKKYVGNAEFAEFVESWLFAPGDGKSVIESRLAPIT